MQDYPSQLRPVNARDHDKPITPNAYTPPPKHPGNKANRSVEIR